MILTVYTYVRDSHRAKKLAHTYLQAKLAPAEAFAKWDHDADGYWSDKEQWNMLKDLFPGLRPGEHMLLFEAFQDVDKNGDGRISQVGFASA